MNKQSSVCPICCSWMQEHVKYTGWLRCGCGYHAEITKKIVRVMSEPDLEEKLKYLDKLAGLKKDE